MPGHYQKLGGKGSQDTLYIQREQENTIPNNSIFKTSLDGNLDHPLLLNLQSSC